MTENLVADDRERALDPRSVTAQRIGIAIACAILAVLGLIAVGVFLFAAPLTLGIRASIAVGILGLGLLFIGLSLWWPGVAYKHTRYRVGELGIRIRRGVVWRTVQTVPRSRVQHTDVSQGPIERAFELATLVIYTAGTQHASISLGGLRHQVALGIRDHLIEGGDDDAV